MNSELLLSPFAAEGRSLRGTLSFVGTPSDKGFNGASDGKESTCNMGDLGSILGLGRSPGGGHGNPLLLAWRIRMDRGAWQAIVHGVKKSQTPPSD